MVYSVNRKKTVYVYVSNKDYIIYAESESLVMDDINSSYCISLMIHSIKVNDQETVKLLLKKVLTLHKKMMKVIPRYIMLY